MKRYLGYIYVLPLTLTFKKKNRWSIYEQLNFDIGLVSSVMETNGHVKVASSYLEAMSSEN